MEHQLTTKEFTLSKKVVLLAALFFSVTAFADTCPEVNKIKLDHKYWVADGGWSSVLQTAQPTKFVHTYINKPTMNGTEAKGRSYCFYENNEKNKGILLTILQQKTHFSTIDTSNNKSWKADTSIGSFGKIVLDRYSCFANNADVNECEFKIVNVANPFSLEY